MERSRVRDVHFPRRRLARLRYDHVVYNDATSDAVDRFVLIVETWHPALTNAEREALSDLFALRDLFGLLEHKRAPFGISDEAATALLDRGARLGDWRLL